MGDDAGKTVEGDVIARLAVLEEALADLRTRVERMEGPPLVEAPPATELRTPSVDDHVPVIAPAASPTLPSPGSTPPPKPVKPSSGISEELLGGKGLAWIGGAAVLLGLVFFLALAIREGYISEGMRVLLAGAASAAFAFGGLWLHEKKGKTDAALVLTGVGVAGAFATLLTATQRYQLIGADLGLLLAGAVGVGATAVAIHLNSREIAGMGIIGALIAPALVGAETSGLALAYMVLALVAACVVTVSRDWPWVWALAFLVTVSQLAAWVDDRTSDAFALALIVTAFFGAIHLGTAIAYEVLRPVGKIRGSVGALIPINATATALIGLQAIDEAPDFAGPSKTWVMLLGLAHLAIGVTLLVRFPQRLVGMLVGAVGFTGVAIALGMILDGPVLVIAWSVQAVVAAWLGNQRKDAVPFLGSLGLLAAAAFHVLRFEAPIEALQRGVPNLANAMVALAVLAAACVGAGWFAPNAETLAAAKIDTGDASLRSLLFGVAAVVGLYLLSIVVVEAVGPGEQRAQVALSIFWGLLGLGAVVVGLSRRLAPVRLAGLALLGLSMAKLLLYDLQNLNSVSRALAFVVVGLIALAGAFAYQRLQKQVGEGEEDSKPVEQ